MKTSTLGLAALICLSSCEKTEVVEVPLDNRLTQSSSYYLYFKVPSRFKKDPQSHEGERKWWCRFDDPKTGLSVESVSYGYISELDLLATIPGWEGDVGRKTFEDGRETEVIIQEKAVHKNLEEYFTNEMLPSGCEHLEFPKYDRFIYRETQKISVYFLNKSSKFAVNGMCYEQMFFSCEEGDISEHESLVMSILENARPWMTRD